MEKLSKTDLLASVIVSPIILSAAIYLCVFLSLPFVTPIDDALSSPAYVFLVALYLAGFSSYIYAELFEVVNDEAESGFLGRVSASRLHRISLVAGYVAIFASALFLLFSSFNNEYASISIATFVVGIASHIVCVVSGTLWIRKTR